MLLSSETGHFSLVRSVSECPVYQNTLLIQISFRALHLADLVTELNGKTCSTNIIRPWMLTPLDRILWRQDRNLIIIEIMNRR